MKHFYFCLMVVCVLLWPLCSCSSGSKDNENEPDDTGSIVEVPEFLGYRVISDLELEFRFTVPVAVVNISFEPSLEIDAIEEGKTVQVRLKEKIKPGIQYMADILAEDEWGNMTSVQAFFEMEAPKINFLDCSLISDTEIDYTFSMPVKVISMFFEPYIEIESIEEGSIVKVYLEKSFKQGIQYLANFSVENEWGAVLDVQIPFETEAPALIFLDYSVVSETEIDFTFSAPVKAVSLSFTPALEIDLIEDGKTVRVKLNENLGPGLRLMAELLAEDEFEQTLSLQIPLRIKNTRVPQLLINELRTEYSKPKGEFIELKMMSAGNLGGLQVFIAGNNKSPMIYEFLPVDVAEGEYVVLHLRTLEDNCVDEYGTDLGESGGTDSSPTARDFWIPGSDKLLHKTDAVYIVDQEGSVLNAVMISETPDSWWRKAYFAEAAEFLFNSGAWKSPGGEICSPDDAVSSAAITATKSISRDETMSNTGTAVDWYVSKTSGSTPGLPNTPK